MCTEAMKGLFTLCLSSAHRVSDDSVIDKLMMIHRELKVLITLELHIWHTVILGKCLWQEGGSMCAGVYSALHAN